MKLRNAAGKVICPECGAERGTPHSIIPRCSHAGIIPSNRRGLPGHLYSRGSIGYRRAFNTPDVRVSQHSRAQEIEASSSADVGILAMLAGMLLRMRRGGGRSR